MLVINYVNDSLENLILPLVKSFFYGVTWCGVLLCLTNLYRTISTKFKVWMSDDIRCVLVHVLVIGLHHGFDNGYFRVTRPEKKKIHGSRKTQILVITDQPKKMLTFFFEFVSMLVKLSENIFRG